MKKNIFFKNTGRISLIAGLFATALLSSCMKDTSPGTINFGNSPALVGFQYYGFQATPITTPIHGTPQDSTGVEVTLSVASIALKTPVTVTLATDTTDAQAYVTANGGKVLPASDYSLVNNGKITIEPGQQIVKVWVKFQGQNINFSNNYVVGLKITNANGAIIASNLNVAILKLTLQSIYQGTYSIKGFILRVNGGVPDTKLGGNFNGYTQELSTIGANQVGFVVLWADGSDAGSVDGTSFTVDPATNAVTVSATGNATLTNAPGYNSRYDPATKTFYVSFVWNTPGTRASTDTLTYVGP